MNKSFESQRHRGTLLHRTSTTLRVVVSLGFKKLNRISTVQVSDTTKLNGYSSAKYKYKTLQIKMAVKIITAIEKFLFQFYFFKTSAIVLPISAGLATTCTPHSLRIFIFAAAVSSAPPMI